MNYVKVILATLAVAACMLYLGWIFVYTSGRKNEVCDRLEIRITDAHQVNFVDSTFLLNEVKAKGLYPVGKKFADIDLNALETTISHCPMVLKALCYRTPAGEIKIEVKQRRPMYRVIPANGTGSYFVDENHEAFPTNSNSPVEVPLLSGYLTKDVAADSLFNLMTFIKNDKFWREQATQVYVDEKQQIIIVPRVGEHIILLGNTDNFKAKLERVETFYHKVLNEVGWNLYDKIDVRYENQIICTPIQQQ